MARSENPFGAADPAVGYLYQIRLALLLSLSRLRHSIDFQLSIELVDDVAFETSGSPSELLQAKHHRSRSANLTNASPDLWKSLRIWIEGRRGSRIGEESILNLMTTSTAGPGSGASHLRHASRNAAAAATSLRTTAQSSKTKENAQAYAAFLTLSQEEQIALLQNVYILDGAPDIQEVDDAIASELFWAVERKHLDTFREYLEGWWFRRTITHLFNSPNDRILGAEIDARIIDLRDQFKQDALPIADDLINLAPDESLFSEKANAVFVQQLELAKAGEKRILAAIRDFYRAFEQRSRWLRDDLLVVGDLTDYERKLVEAWELVFEAIKDELGEAAADAEKEQAARKVLGWAEQASVPVRPRVTEPFVTRGSLHILADSLRVGWHLEFRERLAHLLNVAPAAA